MVSSATGSASLLTLLYPAPGGQAAPQVALRRVSLTVGAGVAVCVTTFEREDWLLISKEDGEKRLGDFVTDARIAGFRKHVNGETNTLFECQQPSNRADQSA
ncbi:MAG: hypothetical protein ACR2P1_19240 [Pseudomonadales bacterium]